MYKQLDDHVNEKLDTLENDVKKQFNLSAKDQHKAIQKEFLNVKKLNEQLHVFVESIRRSE